MADGSLNFDTKVDTTNFDKSIANLEKAFDKFENSVNKLSDHILKLFNGMETAAEKAAAKNSEVAKSVDEITQASKEAEQQAKELQEQMEQIPVHHWNDEDASAVPEKPRTTMVDPDAMGYDETAMKYISEYGEEAQKHVNEFRQEITALENQLKALEGQGMWFGDEEYDEAYLKLSKVKQALADYKKEMISPTPTPEIPVKFDLSTFEGQKRQLRSEIAELEKQGITFGNKEYDERYVALQKVIAAENEYKKSLLQVDDAQEEVKKSADKMKKSVDKAGTSAQKSGKKMTMMGMIGRAMLISFAMQTVMAIGNMVKEGLQNIAQYSEDANEIFSELSSSSLYLKNSFASAFSPILSYVIPALTALIDTISNVMAWIAQLFAVLGGNATFVRARKTQEDYAASLKKTGSAAKEAGKDAERSTASFDKLNVIAEQGTGGGGGSGTAVTDPSEMFETVNVDSELQASVARAKLYLEEFLNWFGVTFNPLLEQIIETGSAIVPGLFDSFNMVCSDIWNLALYPLLMAMLTMGIPMIVEFAAEFVATLEPLFFLVKGIFDRIWKDAVAPILGLISQMWVDCIEILYNAWEEYGASIFESIREALDETSQTINAIWDKYIKPVFDNFMDVADRLWKNHIKPLMEHFVEFGAKLMEVALDIYRNVILPLISWFADELGPYISSALNLAMEVFGLFGVFITGIIDGVLIVLNGLLDFLHIGFTQGWDEAWNNAGDIFRGVFNGIVQIAENAINYIIESLNKLSFDVPDWIPKIGGEKFGFSISKVKLPRLASGTVIPPRAGEFAAILGDNNREAEVVSPISAMKQAFKEAIDEMRGGDGDIRVNVYLDGKVVYEDVVKRNRQAKKQTGKNPLLT